MTVIAELKKTEKTTRTLKLHLNYKLQMDSDAYNYNLRGTVIMRELVKNIKYNIENDTHIVETENDINIEPELAIATNTREECIRLYRKDIKGGVVHTYYDIAIIPTKHIEKIEIVETKTTILTP